MQDFFSDNTPSVRRHTGQQRCCDCLFSFKWYRLKARHSEGIDGLPKSDVLKFFLEDNCSIVVRPSGTESKLKAYISVSATTKEEAQVVEGKLARAVEEKMQKEKNLFYYLFDDKSLMVPFSSYRWGGWHKR